MLYDAVVIGAGTAGAATAGHLAELGMKVLLADARPLDRAGARWVNGVAPWMFERAGLAQPKGAEHRGCPDFSLLGVSGRRYLTIAPNPVMGVDMRLLVQRLHERARAAEVQVIGGVRVGRLEHRAGRPYALEIGEPGHSREVRAGLFVDASGTNGVLRRQSPLAGLCPPVEPHDLCSAAQAVHHIADPAGASRFLERHEAREHETLCRTGVSGGYSIGNVCVEEGEVDLLTGAIAQDRYQSGPQLLDGILQQNPWIGPRVFGGAGSIPVRRPYDVFTGPGLALVGDAACQVFPAHGSGIGIGMIAGRVLAESLSGGTDPGDLKTLWAYQSGFMREFGGLLAAYEVFRRASQSLEGHQVEALLRSGLVNAAGYRAGLEQRLPQVDAAQLASTLQGARRAPRLAAHMGRRLAKMGPLAALYRRFPLSPRGMAIWSRMVGALGRA